MRALFKDALKYALPVAAVLAVVVTVGSWYSGDNGPENYAFAMCGAVCGFLAGLAGGGVESKHTYREDDP